jgi:hypothetical protein
MKERLRREKEGNMQTMVHKSCDHMREKIVIFSKFYWKSFNYRMEEIMSAFRISIGKRSLGSPRRRWEDNISMDLEEINAGNWLLFCPS